MRSGLRDWLVILVLLALAGTASAAAFIIGRFEHDEALREIARREASLQTAVDPALELARLARSQNRFYLGLAATALAGTVVTWIGSKYLISKPLEQIVQGTRDLTAGHFETTIDATCGGSIGELVDAFNQLSRSLQASTVSRIELAAREKQLQLALESTHTGCWDVDLDKDEATSTLTIESYLGYDTSSGPPSRQWWKSLVHPDDLARKEQALRDYLDGSATVYECEYRVKAASGEWRWVLDRGHAVTRRDDGRPRRMVGTDTDITRLKRDEHFLQGNNRVLEAIARGERLPEVFSLLIEFVEAADPGAKATALRLNSYTGQLHGIGRNRMPDAYNQAIDGVAIGDGVGSCGTAAFTGQRVVVSDVMAHEYWAPFRQLAVAAGFRACWSEPILDRNGNVLGTFAIYHDTPREPGEESLRVIETAAKLSAIAIERDNATSDLSIRDRALAASSNGVVIVDARHPEQPVVYCNRAFERITGYDSSEVIGHNCRLLQSGDTDQPGLQEIRQAIREQRACRVTLRNVRKNNEPFWNELSISPVFDDDGQLTHFVGVQDDVSQRLEAEAELATSEKRFRTLFDFAPEAITVFDVETMRFVDFNQNAVDLFGVDSDRMLTLGPLDLSPEYQPDGRPSLSLGQEFAARALAGEAPTFEWQHLRPDGTAVFTEVRLVQLPSADRNLIRGSVTDISERKRFENTLRQAEAKFHDLYEHAPDMYLSVDLKSLQIVECNSTTLSVLGYTRDELIGKPVIDLYTKESAELAMRKAQEFRRTGKLSGVELRVVKADGSIIDISLSASAIRDDDGAIIHSRSIWRDITQRKQAERAEALARFESIASNIPDCFWRTRINADHSYHVEYVSPAWTKIWGYSPEELLSNAELWVEVVLEEDRPAAHQAFENVLTTGERQTATYRIQTRDGKVRWIEDRMSAIVDESGRVILLEGVARDVTEQRMAEELARQHMEQLAHVGRLTTVGELATGIAHELNQPLTAIVNTAFICEQNLTQKETLNSQDVRNSVSTISEQAFRASEIIRRLRSLVKRAPITVSSFDVNTAIKEVVSLLAPDARQNRIAMSLFLDDDLPHISADEVQFQQVILNLLKNACDALLLKSGCERQITIESKLTDSQDVMISVSDNGLGLPDGPTSRAFDAFYTTKDDGMGMGLAISRSIVEAHRGRLWAENNSQGGATFRLTLPVTMERRRRA